MGLEDITKKVFKNEKLALIFISLIFSAFFISNIYSPGVWNDEAAVGIVADHVSGSINEGRMDKLPHMQWIHPVTVTSYLVFPFVYLFGSDVFSVRLALIFYAVGSLWLMYYLCRDWFGKKVAFITFLLTATNLAFFQYTKLGNFHKDPYVVFLFWTGLFFIRRFFKKQRLVYLFLGFFIFGLALSVKLTFLVYIMALVASYLIWHKKVDLFKGLSIKHMLGAFISFCAGSYFLIEYNLREDWITVKSMLGSLFAVSHEGRSNASYLDNLLLRTKQLFMMIGGNLEEKLDWGVLGKAPIEGVASIIILGLFLVSFVAIFIFAISKRVNFTIPRRKILFLYIFYGIVFLCTPFALSKFYQEHLIFIFPFPQIVCALFLVYIAHRLRRKQIALIFIYSIFLILPLFYNIWTNVYYANEMKKNGGTGPWSTAIYGLAGYLQENRIKRPICFFQEPATSIEFLSNHNSKKVLLGDTEECFRYFRATQNEQVFADNVEIIKKLIVETHEKYYLNKQDYFYIISMDSIEMELSESEALKIFIEDYNKQLVLEKIFSNRAGEAVYYLYRISS